MAITSFIPFVDFCVNFRQRTPDDTLVPKAFLDAFGEPPSDPYAHSLMLSTGEHRAWTLAASSAVSDPR